MNVLRKSSSHWDWAILASSIFSRSTKEIRNIKTQRATATERRQQENGKYPGRTINYIMKQDSNETFVDCEEFICTYRLEYSIASGGKNKCWWGDPFLQDKCSGANSWCSLMSLSWEMHANGRPGLEEIEMMRLAPRCITERLMANDGPLRPCDCSPSRRHAVMCGWDEPDLRECKMEIPGLRLGTNHVKVLPLRDEA